MTDLQALLEAAKAANPGERIQLRDSIAAHGARAIPAMSGWLDDARLGAFAVRVLERIAEEQVNRRTVLDALVSADRENVSEPVAGDISEAISRIGGVSPRGGHTQQARRKQAEQWPGPRAVSPLELRFHDAMLDIFRLAGEATRRRRPDGTTARGYWASYFLRGVRNHGGPDYARQLLRAEGTSAGFQRLTDEGRLDLSVEALVLKPEYAELFTDNERITAARRLRGLHWPPRE